MTIDGCIATIHRLKQQRANVRHSLTLHESLLIGPTRDVGKTLAAELRKAESQLTDLINETYEKMRQLRKLEAQRRQGVELFAP